MAAERTCLIFDISKLTTARGKIERSANSEHHEHFTPIGKSQQNFKIETHNFLGASPSVIYGIKIFYFPDHSSSELISNLSPKLFSRSYLSLLINHKSCVATRQDTKAAEVQSGTV